MRKAQITLYVIVGLVVIISFLLIISNKNNFDSTSIKNSELLFESAESLFDECVKQSMIEGEKKYGLNQIISPKYIEAHMMKEIPTCIDDFNILREKGYDINYGELIIEVKIMDELLQAQVNYPIEFKKDENVKKLSSKTYNLPRSIIENLNEKTDTQIVSSDGSFIMEIPKNTEVTLNGEEITQVGIKLLDSHFNDLSNSVLAGALAFEGIPKGAIFSNPIKITYFYDDESFPVSVNENDLSIGYYDDRGIWIGLPTTVDSTKNSITVSNVKHFTPFGAVLGCKKAENQKTVVVTPLLIQQKCNPCEGWTLYPEFSPEIYELSDIITIDEGIGEEVTVCELYDYMSPNIEEEECLELGEYICDSQEECFCEFDAYGYNKLEDLYGKTQFFIEFKGNGDSCLSIDDEDKDINVYYNNKEEEPPESDIELSPFLCTLDDECKVFELDNQIWIKGEDSTTFNFGFEVYNKEGLSWDACIGGHVKAVLSGIGLESESYLTCSAEQLGEYDFTGISICSECIFDQELKINRWKSTDFWNCNNEINCANTMEGITRLNGETCQTCKNNKWIDTEENLCIRCKTSMEGFPRCVEYESETDRRRIELAQYAKYIDSHGYTPVADFFAQLIAFSRTQGGTEEEIMEDILEVLNGFSKDDITGPLSDLKLFFTGGGQNMRGDYFIDLAEPNTDLRPDFDDDAYNQLFHIWFYVGKGYFSSPFGADIGNTLHEGFPDDKNFVREDFLAAEIGIALGSALNQGKSLSEVIGERNEAWSFYPKMYDELISIFEDNPLYEETVTFDNFAEIMSYALYPSDSYLR